MVLKGTNLHAIRIKLSRVGNTSRIFNLNQAFPQSLQLVVYWQQRLRYRFGRYKQHIHQGITPSYQVKKSLETVSTMLRKLRPESMYPLSVDISRLAMSVKKIAINAPFVNLVEFPLVHIQVCLSQRPCLGHR